MPEMLLADIFKKEFAFPELCNIWKLPWERTKVIFPQGLCSSLIDSMNNRCKICIRVWRRHTSYWSTHICFILARKPIFLWLFRNASKNIFFIFHFLIFRCGDMWIQLCISGNLYSKKYSQGIFPGIFPKFISYGNL